MECKKAAVINGKAWIGDRVMRVGNGEYSSFCGNIVSIEKRGRGSTLVTVKDKYGDIHVAAAKELHKTRQQ